MKLTVGVLGRASGVRGEVRVSLRTDNPQRRFAPGTRLLTEREDFPTLTVRKARLSGKHFVVSFEEISDRNVAEALSGTKLLVETDDTEISVEKTAEYSSGASQASLSRDSFGDLSEEIDAERSENGAEEGFYRHELVGLKAVAQTGEILGEISDLLLGAAQDLLEVTTSSGEKVLVPFVYEIVPEVNLEKGEVLMIPPGGLFPRK